MPADDSASPALDVDDEPARQPAEALTEEPEGVEHGPAVPLTACTVATLRGLPAVRVLARSFLEHHPGARFHALVVDGTDDDLAGLGELGAGADFLRPADLRISAADLAVLHTAYPPNQLCAVLRPQLLRWLVTSSATSGPVLYLDPSVLVLGSIAEPVLTGLVEHSLVLQPRVLRPLPEDGLRPDAAQLRAAGLFDPALVAANRGAEAFLASWAEHALREPADADTFLDGAAVLLAHHVLRDPGIGLSVWNASTRPLRADHAGAVTVADQHAGPADAGVPLRTVHFAGFDPNRPWLLSAEVANRPRVLLSEHRLLAKLCAAYVNALAAASQPGDPVQPAQRVGSSAVPAGLRDRYRAAWLAADRAGEPAPPALSVTPAEFLAWACASDGPPGSTRWSAAVWAADAGLRRRFPDPFGVDADGFREWCAGTGVSSGALPPEAVPTAEDTDTRLTDQLGVSVLGSGPVAVRLRAAATASGLPVSSEPDYPVVLCCAGVPSGLAQRRYVIAAPDNADAPTAYRGAHEVWALSAAARSELDGSAGVPVHTIPLPVTEIPERDPARVVAARTALGWPAEPDALVFCCVVEHAHERADNALGAVAAFTAAFEHRVDVRLLLLVAGAGEHPEAAERLRLAIVDDDRIELVEDVPAAERAQWLDTVDCLVAPHRTERGDRVVADRVGLLVSWFVARGVPVVGVAAGATAELLEHDGALLVPTGPDGREPDQATLAEVLRAVAADPAAAGTLGTTGRTELLRTHSVELTGAKLRDRVEHAYHTWRARNAAAKAPQRSDPLRPLRSAKHVLLRQPDVDAGYKIPMAPALRKAVLRVLAHYDAHQRTILSTLVDGMERSVEQVAARQEAAAAGPATADLDGLVEQLDRLTERIGSVDDRLIAMDDGALRARADLAGQSRRVAELEDAAVGEATRRGKQVAALTDRIDRLTEALDRTLDRMDDLETRVAKVLRDQETRTETGLRAASHALRTSDALRRVVLREHERQAVESTDESLADLPPSSLVLSDAGLLRLPADDGVMLPLLSSNGVWEQDLSALIDSLVEPGGIFVDIGAYVGYHTLRVLSRLGTSGAVVAVEPSEIATKLLRHNVSVNVPEVVADQLTVLPSAAWDTAGMLAAEPAMTGGVLVRPTPPGQVTTGETEPDGYAGDTVPAVRLDRELDGIESLRGMPLSVVRVDIPGGGHRALGGLVRLLRRDRPHVFCAFSPSATTEMGDDPVTVLREFDTWGFDVLVLGDREPADPQSILAATQGQHSTTLWLRPRGKPA